MRSHRFFELGALRFLLVSLAVLALAAACGRSAEDELLLAQQAIYQGDLRGAAGHYQLARGPSPGRAKAQRIKVRALFEEARLRYLELREPAAAAALYRELIAIAPDAPEALPARVQLSEILRRELGDLPGARALLQTAIAQEPPQTPRLRYELAKLYFQAGDYEACASECQRIVELGAPSLIERAALLQAQAVAMIDGQASDAIRLFEQWAGRFATSELSGLGLHELGRLQGEAGLLESAIEHLVRALKTHPHPAAVQAAIASARRRLEEDVSARARLARMQLAALRNASGWKERQP